MIAVEPQGFLTDDANVERLCALGGVSRAGYYRHFGPHPAKRDDADLRDLIQKIALDNRHYGYRRIAQELRRQGLIVNDKRVRRLTREDNLLSQRVKPFVPATTMSRHGFAIVPNRTRGLIPTGLDQIWVADITYVRLAEGFVYLAAILDAFSRKVIGWAIADISRRVWRSRLSTRRLPPAIRRPTASSTIPIRACNTPAALIESDSKSIRSPPA